MSNGYGSGIAIPGTGITCNNSLDEPEVNPQGFFQLPPGGKFVSNMSPLTARRDNVSCIVIGTPDASRIATTLLQGWINLAMEGMDVEAASRAARCQVEKIKDEITLQYEPGVDVILAGELFRLRVFEQPDMYFGALNIAGCDRSGSLIACSDGRRHGGVLVMS